jgi:hypothetical protein
MLNVDIRFPAIATQTEMKDVFFFKKNIGLISKGGESFYRNLFLIDSTGTAYSLMRSSINGPAKVIKSITYFQPMYEMNLVFKEEKKFDLDGMKAYLINHISGSPSFWEGGNGFEITKARIYAARTIADTIMVFS